MNLPDERERVGMCACASQMAKRHEKKGGGSAGGGDGSANKLMAAKHTGVQARQKTGKADAETSGWWRWCVLMLRFTSASSMRVRVTLQREAALVQRKAHTTQQLHQRVRFYLKLTHLAINLLNSAISYMKQKL